MRLLLFVLAIALLSASSTLGDLYTGPYSGPSVSLDPFSTTKKWDSPTPGVSASVTFSFVTMSGLTYDETALGGGSGTLTPLASFMPSGALDAIRDAFDAWAAVANITFTEVADSGNSYNFTLADGDADIRIAGHAFDGANGVLAHTVTGFFSDSPLDRIVTSWIDFDLAESWTVNSIDSDSATKDIFQVAAHEIGHAIGLGHVVDSGALMNAFYSEAGFQRAAS